ncbi:type II toxin-antitoxin system TacA family antitoxin [Ursidibacter arcticus]
MEKINMRLPATKARLEAKVNVEIYELLKQAATISGRTLTDFVVSVAYEEAKKTISEHQVLRLTLNDQAELIESLSKPFEPNQSMKNALDIYEEYLSMQGKYND